MSDVPEEVTSWCRRFATAAGLEPPTNEEVDTLLSLAGVAAHASARQSAPITCWLAARAGLSPAEALSIASGLSDEPNGRNA
ncbi:MAG TPA: DUF6457 domain-containing protein [Acidimicrobiales bacterium]|jgi:hypothetical protein|nr:DUF6457 domain-containing protein [Acidimicrobiales bacterium]